MALATTAEQKRRGRSRSLCCVAIRSTEQLLARLEVVHSTRAVQLDAVATWLDANSPDPELVYDLILTGYLPEDWTG